MEWSYQRKINVEYAKGRKEKEEEGMEGEDEKKKDKGKR